MNKAILAKRVRDPRSGEVHSPSEEVPVCSPSAQVGQFIAIEEERFFGSS